MQKEYIVAHLSRIKSDLVKKGIEKVGLFGSFAKENANDLSDIDIAIKLNSSYLDEHDVWEYFRLIESLKQELRSKFSRKVDIYDLDSTGRMNEAISKDIIYV